MRAAITPRFLRDFKSGALAFARPYEGVHITLFYDRVQAVTEPELTGTVLAHVLVHEITHILQGTCRHSATGVMKARLDSPGLYGNGTETPFIYGGDIALIQSGRAHQHGPVDRGGASLSLR